MNTKFTALFVALTLFAPSFALAGQALGTAKARGDYRPYWQAQQSVTRQVRRSRPTYRYSAPQSAPVIVRSAPVISEVPTDAVAQAPVEVRRFSQAPSSENGAVSTAKPCPESAAVTSQPSSGRRYSYAPAPQYSGNPVRRYSGNAGRSSQPAWALPKTAPGKYSTR
jgi:hypothetical protein